MTTETFKIAGAPISWGVCEVPGWGHQLTPARVLAEMQDIGLSATELGPDGFLPADPQQMATTLEDHGLSALGGFTPLLMHVKDYDPIPEVERLLEGYAAANAHTMVLSSITGQDGYDSRPVLDEDGWAVLLRNMDRVSQRCAENGVRAVLHPHVGTMIENTYEVKRLLEGSSMALCLDTGHLLIGGTDPAELTREAAERVAHTHMKDVDVSLAAKVQDGKLTYTEAVVKGMYRPLGDGDVDVEAIISNLKRVGYDGWYVLEQDTILTEDPRDEGPIASVRQSADYLRSVLRKHN